MKNQKMNPGLRVRANVRAGGVTIYGSDNCGWTTKQKATFDAKGIPYEYVNCDKETCPTMVKAFPTVFGYPGETDNWTGFKEI